MHRRFVLARAILAAAVTTLWAVGANAQQFQAQLSGFQELGAINNQTGAIFTSGKGTLTLKLDQKAHSLTYTLTYSGLTTNVTQSHIHFGKTRDSGGIFLFLCTNLGNGPAGTPACPPAGGTVTGVLTDASVVAIPTQNVNAGDFSVVTGALLSDTAYGNVHTTKFPAGEIRGQIRRPEDDQQNQNQNQNQQ
jgi:hypothetical protein